jgi:hypothetical protein
MVNTHTGWSAAEGGDRYLSATLIDSTGATAHTNEPSYGVWRLPFDTVVPDTGDLAPRRQAFTVVSRRERRDAAPWHPTPAHLTFHWASTVADPAFVLSVTKLALQLEMTSSPGYLRSAGTHCYLSSGSSPKLWRLPDPGHGDAASSGLPPVMEAGVIPVVPAPPADVRAFLAAHDQLSAYGVARRLVGEAFRGLHSVRPRLEVDEDSGDIWVALVATVSSSVSEAAEDHTRFTERYLAAVPFERGNAIQLSLRFL